MLAPSLLLLLFFTTLASCAFKSVFVIVLDDNIYLPSLEKRGVPKEFFYGAEDIPLINSISHTALTWNVYTDTNVECGLMGNTILQGYPFMIESSTLPNDCTHFRSSSDIYSDYSSKLTRPMFGFYFPDKSNARSADWLRRFIDLRLFNRAYMKHVITVVLSRDQLKQSTMSAIVLGKNIAHYLADKSTTKPLIDLLRDNGMELTDRPARPANARWFDKVFTIVLENQPLAHSLRDSNFRKLMERGTLLTNYMAIVNPSQPNYVAMVAGDLMGVHDDEHHDLKGRFIVDSMEEKGISWKAYMENFPGNCFSEDWTPDYLYRRKHNPFMLFDHVRENKTLCDKIVVSDQLYQDVADNALPQYSFYTPNMNNDGHDTGIAFAGNWLYNFLLPLLTNQAFMEGTLVVVTFDEGIKPDNKIYTLFIGDNIPAGHLDRTWYSHYSYLRMIEEEFGLPLLGREDSVAPLITPNHFYPGSLPVPGNHLSLFGLMVAALACSCLLAVTIFYVKVIRKAQKASAPPSVGMEEKGQFLGEKEKDMEEVELDGADVRVKSGMMIV